jgi:hypothetical protein
MFQPNDEAVAAPKLNIMAIDEALVGSSPSAMPGAVDS